MFKFWNLSLIAIVMTAFSFIAKVEAITPAKAAELACHRLERLALQKKIDKSYLTQFQKMTVESLQNDSSGAAFAVTAYQVSSDLEENIQPLSITILLDAEGVILKYVVNEGGVSGSGVNWPGKNPVVLTESGLHYVIDNQSKLEALKPFVENFQSLALNPKVVNGNTVAELTMSNHLDNTKLVLILDLNGKILNKEVLP